MSHYFLDSSALLKRYVVEPGSRWIRALTSPAVGHELFVAAIVRVEAVSALARRRREGRLSALGARNLRLLIERQIGRCIVAEANDAVLQRACDLLERHALRAYDAVQLASALESNDRLQARALAPITFVSADQRLLAAASAEGLAVEDPNLHT
ncbi:MAG: type II toxin-antitoxin system VapC family toxin [Thermomicrobiales bacterium]